MIDPSERALRRRAGELRSSAEREAASDTDTAALLLFYAAECALKSVYLNRHQLADTADSNAQARPARTFQHSIGGLVQSLNIPASAVGPLPAVVLQRTKMPFDHKDLHQAWRYGEKVRDMAPITAWLISVLDWAERAA